MSDLLSCPRTSTCAESGRRSGSPRHVTHLSIPDSRIGNKHEQGRENECLKKEEIENYLTSGAAVRHYNK